MLKQRLMTAFLAATFGMGLLIAQPSITHADTVQTATTATTPGATSQTKTTKVKKAKVKTSVKLSSLQSSKTTNLGYTPNMVADNVVASAAEHVGEPYVYGGTTPGAFDCSGLTQYVYNQVKGVSIPRVAQAQYNNGKKVSVNNLKTGDLVFFGSDASHITHVGIYAGNGDMIDAQNRGVIKESIYASWWNLVGAARY